MSETGVRERLSVEQWGVLASLLLDFQAYPGRYAVVMREPRLLFERATEILMLAAGRAVEGLPEEPELETRLREAARFFVRVAMLRPSADHYALLGLEPGFDPATLREHYRMLMRLTHPDFSTAEGAWPVDAATRINLANDVLASAERRRDYDAAKPKRADWQPPVAVRPVRVEIDDSPRPRRWPAVAGVVGVALLLLAWFWPEPSQHDRLQKLAQAAVAEPEAVQQPPAAPPVGARTTVPAPAPAPASEAALGPAPAPAPELAPAQRMAAASALAPAPAPAQDLPPVQRIVAASSPAPALAPVAAARASPELPAPRASVASVASVAQAAARPAVVAPLQPAARPMATPVAAATRVPASPIGAPQAIAATSSSLSFSRTLQVMPAEGSRVVVSAVVPAQAESVAPAPMVAQAQSSAAAVPAAAAPSTMPAATGLRMADVQPLLGQLLVALQSGRGEQVSRLVDRSSSQGDGSVRFVDAYNRAIGGARVVSLGGARFAGRSSGGEQLVVDGVVQLQLQSPDDARQVNTRELVVRAQFASRAGQPVLTQLSAGDVAR